MIPLKFMAASAPLKNNTQKVNSRNTKKRSEICPKLKINTKEESRSGVFIIDYEHYSLFSVCLLLTLNR